MVQKSITIYKNYLFSIFRNLFALAEVLYFANAQAMYDWFAEFHASLKEQWIGFYKVGSGYPSITWSESVDVALCFGWIDGIRKSVDAQRYKIRFTPRNPKSNWSEINLVKMGNLIKDGRMTKSGLEVFHQRQTDKTPSLSPTIQTQHFPPDLDQEWEKHSEAKQFFLAQSAAYRKQIIRWVTSAKRLPTRMKRVRYIIQLCQLKRKADLANKYP